MRINGQGLICPGCKVELWTEQVTMYQAPGSSKLTATTNCCRRIPRKRNWIEKLQEKLWRK